jgi:sirohydrochlorin cobaltochelatase
MFVAKHCGSFLASKERYLRFLNTRPYHSCVSQNDFSDAALVLLGHGSTVNETSGDVVYQHAHELRQRNLFAEVREAFWKQEPKIKDVLSSISVNRIFIVPLFISEGYFSEEVIPQALGFKSEEGPEFSRAQPCGGQTLFYCKPVGTHDGITDVLLERAHKIVEMFPFPRAPKAKDLTLFIAGHGTEQNENSRASIQHQAGLIRAQNLYAGVHAVFLEEPPKVSECFYLAETRHIVVAPFFMSEGMHSQEDIPVMLGDSKRIVQQRLGMRQPPWRNPTERNGKLIWYSAVVGTHPKIAEVILERVKDAAAHSV